MPTVIRQNGFSLLEIIISTLLSSLLLLGILQLMLNQQIFYRNTLAHSEYLNDNQFAFDSLITAIAQSGNQNQFFYQGACGLDNPCTYNDEVTSQIAIIQPGTISNDCTGQWRHIGENDSIANVFFVSDNNHGSKSLYCRGYNITTNSWVKNSRSAPLIDNINQLQFLFLEQSDEFFSYKQSRNVTNWSHIRAVKLFVGTPNHNYQTTIALVNNTGFNLINFNPDYALDFVMNTKMAVKTGARARTINAGIATLW